MFNNDVTQKYNLQDATLEILIMLLGAFLLGYLLCWLLKKLFSANQETAEQALYQERINNKGNAKQLNDEAASPANKGRQPIISTNKQARTVTTPRKNNSSSSSYSTPKIDDFTKIHGITPRIQSLLKNNGVKSFTDLRDIDKQTLVTTLEINENSELAKDAQSWQHQASLAAKGEWNKLSEYQAFIERSKSKISMPSAIKDYAGTDRDDLKKIEGIGPVIEEILNNKGIFTYKDLRKTDRDTLKTYLVEADERFKHHEPETWPLQSGMAERGEWEELKIYQEFMDDDSELFSSDISENDNTIDADESTNKERSAVSDNVTQINKKSLDTTINDDLKKIDGIGPKIEAILNENGIHTYRDLKNTDRDTLKSYLNKAGNQFKMHEPESWPHQANLANQGEWQKLEEYQDSIALGTNDATSQKSDQITTSQNTSLHINKVSSKPDAIHNEINNESDSKDDFKKIEGIGPKIEELLNKAGITTFEQLMECSSTTIKDLLDAAGPQYRMHNPDTWPHQAKMAYKGEWGKLKEYQDFLLGGRE